MDNSRILIVGAYGQLGKALNAKYPGATAVDRDTFDMTDWAMLENYDWSKYDVILNAAVYANVNGAEEGDGRIAAWLVNATGPSYLSKVASKHNITLVHVSSDYVFDGRKRPHTETEPFSPLNVYGQSKAAGDLAVSLAPQHYIVRTTWLIGDGPNFVRTMAALARKDVSPTVVDDQIGRLTFTPTLVDAIDHLLTSEAPYGTYNTTNDGKVTSWADITEEIFKDLGRDDLHVTRTSTEEYDAGKQDIAPRPLLSEMDLSKLIASGYQPNDWQADLAQYIKDGHAEL